MTAPSARNTRASGRQVTSRADTVWSAAAAALSVLLVGVGAVGLLMSERDIQSARTELAAAVIKEARAEQRSPRDLHVLAVVTRAMPADVRLEPSPEIAATGRVEVVTQHLHAHALRVCLVLPASASGRIITCPSRRTRTNGTSPAVPHPDHN